MGSGDTIKQTRITRRDFLKLSVFGAGTVAGATLISVASAPSQAAQAAVVEPHTLAIPQPTFNPIASTLPSGGPPTDLAASWDGTLWAIDTSGEPHLYDPTQDAWLAHGDGVDAVAVIADTYYFFRGTQVLTAPFFQPANAPQLIGDVWPTLPFSFTLGVAGAANVDSKLILFNGGRYVPADGSAKPAKLTDLTGWPATDLNFKDGVIDGVYSDGTSIATLFRGTNYVWVNFQTRTVTAGPAPISNLGDFRNHLLPAWATTGIDAGIKFTANGNVYQSLFKGTARIQFQQSDASVATPVYLPAAYGNWPATWNPQLQHAPSGRVGNLWCATVAQGIVRHDGEQWNVMPGGAVSAAVGQDGTVMVASASGLYRWNGTGYDPLGGSDWVQASVGDANHVWVRDSGNAVRRYDATTGFQPVDLGPGVPAPTHMTANADGTLWHVTGGNPNAFRLISESANPSALLQLKGANLITSVNKVASTGFGAAHCLATHADGSTNVYRYDSPYVFKTAQTYGIASPQLGGQAIEQGLGMLYVISGVLTATGTNISVVALDLHTGREVSRSAPLPFKTPNYTGLVFDPLLNLVYVSVSIGEALGVAYDQTTPGQVLALDARDLTQVKWRYQTPCGVDAAPALSGTQLCFGDRNNTLYMFDTHDALRNSTASQPKWTWQVPTQRGPNITHRVATPVLANGNVYTVVWDVHSDGTDRNVFYVAQCNAGNGSGGRVRNEGAVPAQGVYYYGQPALGRARGADGSVPQVLYFNASPYVHATNIENDVPLNNNSFVLPDQSAYILTGIVYDDGTRLGQPVGALDDSKVRVWFGDTDGNLWALGDELRPTDGTPFQAKKAAIFTTPVLYKDPQGGLTVLFGINSFVTDDTPPALYGYDPDNGNHASMGTGLTAATTLSKTITNGVLYLGGDEESLGIPTLTQVFGIRVDALPQALRDFVIESQLMQDPDENATGGNPANNVPPSVARYQTHLTIVDDQKTPRVHEPVKLWCDTPNTQITVDGQAFTIGPDDASFAAVKTGTDGALVITMNATDYFAPTLRVWAGFMDPYERIVINADTEFHQRVMTAHANAGDDDPTKVNLQTATNYNGQSLFTNDEKSQNPSVPQNIADSIQTANKGLGLGTSKNTYRKLMRVMGVKHKNQRVQIKLIDATPPDKYMAYADLAGATHFPTNIPSTRLASIAQPLGLSFSRPGGDATQLPTFTALSHTDARATIDALQGEAWKPSDPQGGEGSRAAPMRTFNIFQDFWNWLKGLVDKITQCILSIAEDILAGIQYVVDGILKVFKAIIKVLEEVFPFLGSFFKMLEKLIDDVVAALSVLFHFDEIIKTHTYIRDQVNALLTQAETAIANNVKPAVDGFFNSGEIAVKNAFNGLISKIEPNKQGSNLKGAGATAHTAFSAGPGAYGAGSGTSHAVQCNYGMQKLKSNAGAGSEMSGAGFDINRAADDSIIALWTTFTNQISTNPTLKDAFSSLGTDVNNLFQARSAGDFFKTLLVTLLQLIETLIEGTLVIANAFVDLLLNAVSDIISTVQTFLNTPIYIPFISWLYHTVFGEPLTFLNVICLVAAIPVTILYRVVEGRYPSQDISAASTAVAPAQAAVNPVVTKVLGAFSGILAVATGLVNGVNDALGEEGDPFLSKLSAVLSVSATAITIPLASNDAPSTDDWIAWGAMWCGSALGIFGAIEWTGGLAELWTTFSPGLTSAMGLFQILVFSYAFGEDAQFDPNTDLGFAANLLSAIAGVLNPVKLASEFGALAVSVVDAYAGFAVGVIDFIIAFAGLTARPLRLLRYHIPFAGGGPPHLPPNSLGIVAP